MDSKKNQTYYTPSFIGRLKEQNAEIKKLILQICILKLDPELIFEERRKNLQGFKKGKNQILLTINHLNFLLPSLPKMVQNWHNR